MSISISVAICTYNGSQFIEQQIKSILDQTITPNEIVLGDDGSVDDTIDVVKKVLSKSNVAYTIIENRKNMGVFANFQNVIMHCKGDYIFTSDQDDVWLPNKIELIIDCFINNPKSVMVFSNGYVTDKDLNIIGDLWESIHFTRNKRRLFDEQSYYDVLLSQNCVTGAAMAFKRELADKVFPAPSSLTCIHDYWMALHAPLYGDIKMLESPLFYYRQHGTNLIGAKTTHLIDKIRRWIYVSDFSLDNSCEQLQISKIFNEGNKRMLSDMGLSDKMNSWIKFNQWRDSLKTYPRTKAILSVFIHIIIGQYRKYYARSFAGLQDMVACLKMNHSL